MLKTMGVVIIHQVAVHGVTARLTEKQQPLMRSFIKSLIDLSGLIITTMGSFISMVTPLAHNSLIIT